MKTPIAKHTVSNSIPFPFQTHHRSLDLRKIGIKREEIVLLHLTRGFEMMEWIIAVLKSGAAFAVADQKHPVERTLSVISIAKPALVVDDGSGNDLRLEPFQLNEKVLDSQNLAFDEMPISNPEDITKNEDLAYVVFTSGSTGEDFRRRHLVSQLTGRF